jgi:hypothetical protein
MGGGYIQAVAYGSQDIYLMGNPQITFFKAVYKRHTNFAVESIEVGYLGNADFDGKVICTLPTHGDLVKDIFIEWEIDNTLDADGGNDVVPSAGSWLFKQMDIEIGGQLIDRQYADWLKIWSELTTPEGKFPGYRQMTGDYAGVPDADAPTSNKFIVPMQFWFCRNSGLAIPLIALSSAEVKLTLHLASSNNLQHTSNNLGDKSIVSFKIWVDYIFMDTDERRRFAQSGHEYLIEQVQMVEQLNFASGTNTRIPLEFNYPVKELLWWGQRNWDTESSFNEHYMKFDQGHVALNGTQRFYPRRSEYFLNVQNYEHHERIPRYEPDDGLGREHNYNYIYTYSFGLEPEKHQPSGVCNFTRLKSADLYLDNVTFPNSSNGGIRVFAHGYNVLRIMSGMAGLAYSN